MASSTSRNRDVAIIRGRSRNMPERRASAWQHTARSNQHHAIAQGSPEYSFHPWWNQEWKGP
jgi:hypothetical protein